MRGFPGPLTIALILPALLFLQFCRSGQASLLTKKLPPSELKEDAQILKQVILQMHPAVGLYQSRSYYEKTFSDFAENIRDSMTQKDFRLQMKLVLDELHCGHTEVLYSKKFYRQVRNLKLNYSPYIFLPVKNKLYVIANLNKKQDSTLKRGVQVTALNGVGLDSVLKYSRRFVTSDGFSQSGKNHFVQLAFNSFYPSLFGRPDTFSVTYTDGKHNHDLRYAAVSLKNLPILPLGVKDDSLYKKFRHAKIAYRYLDSTQKTMVMKIVRFSHSGDARVYHKLFRKAKKNGTENLVIDLRNNGGGSLSNTYRLLSYLIDTAANQTLSTGIRKYPLPKYTSGRVAFKLTRLAYRLVGTKRTRHDTDFFSYKIKPVRRNHFNGQVFVLINGGSFSASCLVSAYLKKNPRVTFIGEETGGTQEGCNAGVTPFYTLPNSGLRVRVPAFRVIHDVVPELTGHGILPDYPVEYTFRDIVNRRDLEMEKVKEILKSAGSP